MSQVPVCCPEIAEQVGDDYGMTFQVALAGANCVVVGSDRQYLDRGIHRAGPILQPSFQRPLGKKTLVSDDRTVLCAYAGGPNSEIMARRIVTECSPLGLSDIRWRNLIETTVRDIIGSDTHVPDEVIIVRTDNTESFLKLTRQLRDSPSFTPIDSQICTGNNSDARFFPKSFWRAGMEGPELRTLALLALVYAHKENPTGVGGTFDIVTVREQQVQEDCYGETEALAFCEKFQDQLQAMLRRISLKQGQ